MKRVFNRSTAVTPVAAPGLTATTQSSSAIELQAVYAGIAAFQSFTFQYSLSPTGPWTNLATQVSGTYLHTGLTGATTYYYQCFVNAFAVGTSPPGVANAKTNPATTTTWVPGYYGLSDAVLGPGATYSGSEFQTEIAAVAAAKPTVVGYAPFCTWGSLEIGQGGWQFGGWNGSTFTGRVGSSFCMDQIANACANAGLQWAIILNPNIFNATSPSAPQPSDGSSIPAYILQNAGVYGAGAYGSSGVTPTGASGFWVQQTGGYCANFQNSNVMTRLLALITAIGQAFNNDPTFEGVGFCGWDNMFPYAGTGLTGAGYWSGLQTIFQGLLTALPNTNVFPQVAWGQTSGQNLTQWMVQNGCHVSTSDTGGATGFQTTGYKTAVFNASPTGNGGTLLNAWNHASGPTLMQLSTGQTVTATFAYTSTAVTWTPAITGSPTATANVAIFPRSLSDGINAWMGVISPYNGSTWTPPSPPLQSYNTAFPLVEGDDFSNNAVYNPYFTPTDIFNACNQYYKASHVFVSILLSLGQASNVPAALWSNVIVDMANVPLTNLGPP